MLNSLPRAVAFRDFFFNKNQNLKMKMVWVLPRENKLISVDSK